MHRKKKLNFESLSIEMNDKWRQIHILRIKRDYVHSLADLHFVSSAFSSCNMHNSRLVQLSSVEDTKESRGRVSFMPGFQISDWN